MQFLYLDNACKNDIYLKDENFKYIVKVRREKEGRILYVRNLKDDNIYTYTLMHIEKKSAFLKFVKVEHKPNKGKDFRLIWAVVDPKTVEKTLPSLNEMGVGGIDFVYTKFSQKNFKIDTERLNRILISSCEQCGRSDLMQFRIFNDLKSFMDENDDFCVLDFGGETFSKNENIKSVFIGCEGGFSDDEKKQFVGKKVLGFDSGFILKSQTAASAVVAKILL